MAGPLSQLGSVLTNGCSTRTDSEAASPRITRPSAKFEQRDDIHLVNELHVFKENPTVVHLSTRDVIHSFNLPHLRVKQDALPGKIIPRLVHAHQGQHDLLDEANGNVCRWRQSRTGQVGQTTISGTWPVRSFAAGATTAWSAGFTSTRTKQDFLDWLEACGSRQQHITSDDSDARRHYDEVYEMSVAAKP